MAELSRARRDKEKKKKKNSSKRTSDSEKVNVISHTPDLVLDNEVKTVESKASNRNGGSSLESQLAVEFEPFPQVNEEVAKERPGIEGDISVSPEESPFNIKEQGKADVESRIKDDKEDNFFKEISEEYEKLSQLEKDVLKIARDILKKKRFAPDVSFTREENMPPMMEELYMKAISKLTYTKGFSKEDIYNAIKSLVDKKWIISGNRRTKEEILESEIHRKILEFIGKYPGIHARDSLVEKELGISRNPFIMHMMTLEAFGFVRSVKFGKTIHYFRSDIPDVFDDLCALFRNPYVVKIIFAFMDDPKVSISQIARSLGVYHGAIHYHISKLIELNVLIKDTREKSYIVNIGLLKRYSKIFDSPPFFD